MPTPNSIVWQAIIGRRRISPGRLATGDSSVAVTLPACSKELFSKPFPLWESLPQNDRFPEDVILRRPGTKWSVSALSRQIKIYDQPIAGGPGCGL